MTKEYEAALAAVMAYKAALAEASRKAILARDKERRRIEYNSLHDDQAAIRDAFEADAQWEDSPIHNQVDVNDSCK